MKDEIQILVETVIFFIRRKARRIPNKTNILRKNILEDVLKGMKTKDIASKYDIECSDSSIYLNKTLSRWCEYAGLTQNLGIRDFRKWGSYSNE